MSIIEGSDPEKKLKKHNWKGLKANYIVWPFVQFVDFKFVPLEHRVLMVKIISLG
jgi:protein Mpv17